VPHRLCATIAAACARLARNVIDLSRTEIGEVFEPYNAHRGASSTMPQKVNPISSEVIIGFAGTAGALASSLARAQEAGHERAAGEWQIEWQVIPQLAALAGSALAEALVIVDGMRVDADRMRANLELDGGLVMAEAQMIQLADAMGREDAHDLVYEAATRARLSGRYSPTRCARSPTSTARPTCCPSRWSPPTTTSARPPASAPPPCTPGKPRQPCPPVGRTSRWPSWRPSPGRRTTLPAPRLRAGPPRRAPSGGVPRAARHAVLVSLQERKPVSPHRSNQVDRPSATTGPPANLRSPYRSDRPTHQETTMSETPTQADPRPKDPSKKKHDRTHYLYVAVVVAVVAGILVGWLAPEVGKSMAVLGTTFLALIKMIVPPIIFCTIVTGVGSVRKAASVGKIGVVAMVYFLVMSTLAMAIGLLVGNWLQPGSGLNVTPSTSQAAADLACNSAGGTAEFIKSIIPTTMLSSLTSGNIMQTLFVALLVGFAVQSLGKHGEPVLRGVGHIQKVVFKIMIWILWLSPIGAFGAIANVVAQTGLGAVVELGTLMLAFYITCIVFVFGILGALLREACRSSSSSGT
jgi:hypothetical protein